MRSYAARWIHRVSHPRRRLTCLRSREHPAEIPTRQRENPWLQCVEHREQQVRPLDLLHLFWLSLVMLVMPSEAAMIVAVVERCRSGWKSRCTAPHHLLR